MIDCGKKNLLGVLIDAVDYDAALTKIIDAAEANQRCTVTALAVHGVMTGVADLEHRYRLNRFDLVVPDGQPVRWGINTLHHCQLLDRVYGPNLMLRVCEKAAERELPIYLFGATDEMLELLVKNLTARFPRLLIAGREASAFRQVTEEASLGLIERIRESGAKITFVGLGCPRQEVWAYEMGDRLRMPILAVGAAFAFHAGKLSQAPEWMQRRGLEWLFRLGCEPMRLWRRYLFLNPGYLSLLALQKFRMGKFDPSQGTPPRVELRYG